MDRMSQAVGVARSALATLQELLPIRDDKVARDAAIQRFEYTFEAAWKAAKAALRQQEGVEAATPKAAVRASFTAGWLDEGQAEAALQMADDRNLTVHTYNEAVAEELASRLPTHARLLAAWLDAMAGAD